MKTRAYFTQRVYKNTLSQEYVEAITHALFVFNQAKQFTFSTSVKEKRSGENKRTKSMHLTVKERFALDDYYSNSAVQEANAIQKSLTELNKLYIKNKKEQIKSVKNKIKKTKSRLTTLSKLKKSFVTGTPLFPNHSNITKQGALFVVRFKERTDLYYHAYQFEHSFLDVEIKRINSRIGFLTFRKNRFEEELKRLKTKISSVVFGSKKLFKSQYTKEEYKNNHSAWVQKWEQRRYNQMTISGRKDSGSGNFVFKYNPDEKSLGFHTPSGMKCTRLEIFLSRTVKKRLKTLFRNKWIARIKENMENRLVGLLEDHGTYYLIKCIVNEEENRYVNFSRADGIIGIDCNC